MLRTYKIEEIGNYGVIYLLTSPAGKYYVGQSWSPELRFRNYRNLHKKVSYQPKLYNALKKYGDLFIYEIIDLCETQGEMNAKETEYMSLYDSVNNGYNSSFYVDGVGRMSDETKKNMSIAQKKYSANHSNNRKGQTQTEESKRKIGDKNRGKKKSFEEIQKNKVSRCKFTFKITSPDNKIFITKILTDFCRSNNLSYEAMLAISNNKYCKDTYKNWRCEKI